MTMHYFLSFVLCNNLVFKTRIFFSYVAGHLYFSEESKVLLKKLTDIKKLTKIN